MMAAAHENILKRLGVEPLTHTQSANLSHKCIQASDLLVLAELFSDSSHQLSLQTLRLGFNDLRNEGAQIISRFLAQFPGLTCLDLGFNGIGDSGAMELGRSLACNTTLKILYLSGNTITSSGFEYISGALQTNSTLSSLYLTGNSGNAEGISYLSEALCRNKTVEVLFLNGNKMKQSGARSFSEMLKKNTTLTHINLSDNKIGDAGAEVLADALMSNRNIRDLEISFNGITSVGMEKLTASLKHYSGLRRLLLDNNKIGDRGTAALAGVLPSMGLVELNIGFNEILVDGMSRIINGLVEEEMDLTDSWGNRVGKFGLEILVLSGNTIGGDVSRLIGYMLSNNSTLQKLFLDHTNMGSVGERNIASGLSSAKTSALTTLTGFDLGRSLATIGLPIELTTYSNDASLKYLAGLMKAQREADHEQSRRVMGLDPDGSTTTDGFTCIEDVQIEAKPGVDEDGCMAMSAVSLGFLSAGRRGRPSTANDNGDIRDNRERPEDIEGEKYSGRGYDRDPSSQSNETIALSSDDLNEIFSGIPEVNGVGNDGIDDNNSNSIMNIHKNNNVFRKTSPSPMSFRSSDGGGYKYEYMTATTTATAMNGHPRSRSPSPVLYEYSKSPRGGHTIVITGTPLGPGQRQGRLQAQTQMTVGMRARDSLNMYTDNDNDEPMVSLVESEFETSRNDSSSQVTLLPPSSSSSKTNSGDELLSALYAAMGDPKGNNNNSSNSNRNSSHNSNSAVMNHTTSSSSLLFAAVNQRLSERSDICVAPPVTGGGKNTGGGKKTTTTTESSTSTATYAFKSGVIADAMMTGQSVQSVGSGSKNSSRLSVSSSLHRCLYSMGIATPKSKSSENSSDAGRYESTGTVSTTFLQAPTTPLPPFPPVPPLQLNTTMTTTTKSAAVAHTAHRSKENSKDVIRHGGGHDQGPRSAHMEMESHTHNNDTIDETLEMKMGTASPPRASRRKNASSLKNNHHENAHAYGRGHARGPTAITVLSGSALGGDTHSTAPVQLPVELMKSARNLCVMPFHPADLWELHQYFYSPPGPSTGNATGNANGNCSTTDTEGEGDADTNDWSQHVKYAMYDSENLSEDAVESPYRRFHRSGGVVAGGALAAGPGGGTLMDDSGYDEDDYEEGDENEDEDDEGDEVDEIDGDNNVYEMTTTSAEGASSNSNSRARQRARVRVRSEDQSKSRNKSDCEGPSTTVITGIDNGTAATATAPVSINATGAGAMSSDMDSAHASIFSSPVAAAEKKEEINNVDRGATISLLVKGARRDDDNVHNGNNDENGGECCDNSRSVEGYDNFRPKKRPVNRNTVARIAGYPHIKEKLESLKSTGNEEDILRLLRLLRFFETKGSEWAASRGYVLRCGVAPADVKGVSGWARALEEIDVESTVLEIFELSK